jgi:hypothetical protein
MPSVAAELLALLRKRETFAKFAKLGHAAAKERRIALNRLAVEAAVAYKEAVGLGGLKLEDK